MKKQDHFLHCASFIGSLSHSSVSGSQVFVYRGRGFERLPEFQSRILDQFPTAELMTKLSAPTEAEMDRPGQLVQINKVEPLMALPKRLTGKLVPQQILNYYKVNKQCLVREGNKIGPLAVIGNRPPTWFRWVWII